MKDWAKDAEAKEKAMAEARKELERRAEIRNVSDLSDVGLQRGILYTLALFPSGLVDPGRVESPFA